MKKLSFITACLVVFVMSYAEAQVKDTAKKGIPADTVKRDTTLRPDDWPKGDKPAGDTMKKPSDAGKLKGWETDTMNTDGINPLPDTDPGKDRGTIDREKKQGSSTGLRNGNPGNEPVLPPAQ